MKVSKSGYLKFQKQDRQRFISEMMKLSPRARNLLERADMETWDGFYYHLFIKQDLKDFNQLRNSGKKTVQELIEFMRKMFDPQGQYIRVIEKYNEEYTRLNKYTQPILKLEGFSLFEVFCYRLLIKREVIDLRKYRRSNIYTSEAENFIESMCKYLGSSVPKQKNKIYFNPNAPDMPFSPKQGIKNAYDLEFETLSDSTRDFLESIGANNIYGFYTSFISPDSPFNKIFNDVGESNLLEILRIRTRLKEKIKQQID